MPDLISEMFYTNDKNGIYGCDKIINKPHWVLKLDINAKIESFEDCLELVEKFELNIKEIDRLSKICLKCGDCCSHAPEISEFEMNYLLTNFPENKAFYYQIKPSLACPLGGKDIGPCLLAYKARPFQCRILNCQANIVGFEKFYNLLANYLNWIEL